MRGSCMIARATMSRWAMPPESVVDVGPRPVREPEPSRAVSSATARARRCVHAEVTTVEVEVLADVERAVERVRLRDDADDLLGEGRVRDDVDPADRGRRRRSGSTRVVSIPTVVVLPAPFGPSSPKISPARTARSSPSTARTYRAPAPKTLVSPTVRMTSPSTSLGPGFPECDLDGHGTPSPPDGYVMRARA